MRITYGHHMTRRLASLIGLLAFLALLALPAPAFAQAEVKAQLDKIRADITAVDKDIQANLTSDKGLIEQRGKLDPLLDQLRNVIAEQTPRLEGIKARLEQLGPKPDAAKGQPDNPDVARERDEQEKLQRETEGVLALTRNHIVAVEQLTSKITDQRRTLLTRALMERTSSVFSPVLWLDVVKALPGEFRSMQYLFSGWMAHLGERLDLLRLGFLALAALVLGIVAIPGNRYLRRFEARPDWPPAAPADGKEPAEKKGSDKTAPDRPTRKQRALAALRVTIIWAVVPVMVCAGIFNLIDTLDLVPDRLDNVVRTLLFGIAFVAFAHGLADGILGPDDPAWRLVDMDDRTASKIAGLAKLFPAIIVAGKTVEALNQTIYAVLPVTVATKALFAFLGAMAIVRTLRGLQDLREEEGPEAAAQAPAGSLFTAVRLCAWAAALVILVAVGFGYVALGSFLQDQIIWLAMVAAVLLILVALVDEYIGHGVSPEGAVGKQVMQQVGLSKSSLKQISILSNGFFRVVLFVAAAMFALAPWGLDGGDTLGTLKAALFGFSVGGVTISLSNIILAIAFFAIGFSVTRGVKRWLEKSYLPHTKLDVGLRNSIATSIGYLGIIIASMMAASTLGLSLDKFTIVAGALSVGIGFGLQSIVNNFVSGLILLWERPIRVGDWIVVGDEQGIVKRINVRSTQIETFDRAALIVPNSEFISGRVKNWMHNDRTARIVIPIGVGYGSDPDKVRKILVEAAKDNKEVLRDPHPRVYFVRLGDSSMEFELRCFADVDFVLPVKSELMFEIHKQLTRAKIDIPMPRRPREWFEPDREDNPMPDGDAEKSSAKGA
jgi:potassium-dependent mechanosensitive channel